MSKFKGTKGPWEAFIGCGGLTIAIHTPGAKGCDNVVGWMGFDGVDASNAVKVANAKLIAAAPELLDVLETIVDQFSNNGGEVSATNIEHAKGVIRKALKRG
ncbi:hypothetical protein CHUUTOTORO_02540 [Serratia phage vB_SmaM-ChuuTotoro]|nr:hypothetical protein CHUUTOTORO_02540 [Serratia phage vB_SmaM-ChuuTotoro]